MFGQDLYNFSKGGTAMGRNNITKQEWRKYTKDLVKSGVESSLEKTVTTGIRVVILKEPCSKDACYFSGESKTDKEEQVYEFFNMGTDGDYTVYGVYQKHMSMKNADKSICLKDNQPLKSLLYEDEKYYAEAIINFIMANIVWK